MPKNIYRNSKGEVLPGTTTICNQLDKPQLVNWAWKLGKQDKDWKEERNSAGDIGTLVHEMVLANWTGVPIDWSLYTPTQIEQADECVLKFTKWHNENIIMVAELVELPLVSEKYQFGGQPDLLMIMKRRHRLIDIKTGGGIYKETWLQLAGYDILLRENGYKVDEYQILWLPKDNRFDCPIRTDLRKEKKKFKLLLEYYKLDHS